MKKLHLLKPGTFRDMHGQDVTFTAADLTAMAAGYEPDVREAPVVIGHPKHDKPAWGWIASLSADADGLHAVPHQVAPTLADAVAAGQYKKLSAALYGPHHVSNPTPGQWYLRHVGLLGAAPPGVPGLRNVQFADDDTTPDLAVELALSGQGVEPYVLGSIARLFSRLRDYLIDKEGLETADKTVPDWDVQAITEAVQHETRFAEPADLSADPGPKPTPKQTPKQIKEDTHMPPVDETDQAAALAAQAAALNQREAALAAREAEIAAAATQQAEREAAEFAERLVTDGRILPRDQAALASVLTLIPEEATVAFAEGESDTVKPGPAGTFLRQFLSTLPAQVEYAELAAGELAPTTDADLIQAAVAPVNAQRGA